jgi:hypothetical protein
MHLILQLINQIKSKNKSYHSKENTTLKFASVSFLKAHVSKNFCDFLCISLVWWSRVSIDILNILLLVDEFVINPLSLRFSCINFRIIIKWLPHLQAELQAYNLDLQFSSYS